MTNRQVSHSFHVAKHLFTTGVSAFVNGLPVTVTDDAKSTKIAIDIKLQVLTILLQEKYGRV